MFLEAAVSTPIVELSDLTDVSFAELLDLTSETLAAVVRHVFDPEDPELQSVSAFGSAL